MVELRQNNSPARAKVRCAIYTRKSLEEDLPQSHSAPAGATAVLTKSSPVVVSGIQPAESRDRLRDHGFDLRIVGEVE